MMDRALILEILREHKDDLFNRYKVSRMALFGSVARDENGPYSDVDIMVEIEPIGLDFYGLAAELEELLSLRVDLVSTRAIKLRYRDSLERDLVEV